MVKRVLLIGGGAIVLLVIVVGTDAMSYVRTSARCVKDTVHNAVPIEFQIDRARQMIRDLGPEVRENMHLIAKEEIEIARLEKRIDKVQRRADRGVLGGDPDHLLEPPDVSCRRRQPGPGLLDNLPQMWQQGRVFLQQLQGANRERQVVVQDVRQLTGGQRDRHKLRALQPDQRGSRDTGQHLQALDVLV